MTTLTLLTRQSDLALWQTNAVKHSLEQADPSLTITVSGHSTLGDRDKHTPLTQLGNKHSFVSELQTQLLSLDNAVAVHSLKDLSVHPHPQLALGAYLPRADARDVLISPHPNTTLSSLPLGARIGTGSPRRRAQLAAIRPDLSLCDIRGNITTRINACLRGDYDAIILAAAGLHRLGLRDHISEYLNVSTMLPAIGQGIIAVEHKREDANIQALLKRINDPHTAACAIAERTVNTILGGDCHTPIAAYAECDNTTITLTSLVSSPCGEKQLIRQGSDHITNAHSLGEHLAKQLIEAGAKQLLG